MGNGLPQAKKKRKYFKTQTAAAEYAGVSVRTLRRWLDAGLEMTGSGAISSAAIDKFRRRRQSSPSAQPTGEISGEPVQSGVDERSAQRRRMSERRARERDIEIPPVVNPRRRAACKDDPERFCRTYFPDTFYNPFSRNQRYNIAQIHDRILYGGLKAIAASRGDGKSTTAKIVGGVWAIVYGLIRYALLLCATGRFAEHMLEDIKDCYEFNDLLMADFPEICAPVRALEGAAQRAKGQTVAGKRTQMIWSKDRIVLPLVDGSDAAGAIINTRGMDGSIRGLVKNNIRPDLVLIDDGETRESANSVMQTQTRLATIQSDVLGLAGPGRRMPVLYMGTIINKNCVTDKITDRDKHPEWSGERQKRVIKWPKRRDLWNRYLKLKADDDSQNLSTYPSARRFYQENKKAMDDGAQCSNEHCFDCSPDASGKPLEVSAIQNAYNLMYQMGVEAFESEHQNNPPEPSEGDMAVEEAAICAKVNDYKPKVAPADAAAVTVGIDCHDRTLYYTAVAVKRPFVCYIIDYDIEPVYSPEPGTVSHKEKTKQVEIAIIEALGRLQTKLRYTLADGDKQIEPARVLVDAGYMTDAVYQFCRGADNFQPSKGGSTKRGSYTQPKPGRFIRNAGPGFHQSRLEKERIWLNLFDPDKFKLAVQRGFKVENIDQQGGISLFESPDGHGVFAEHICAESWDGDKRKFIVLRRQNHWLDSTAQAVAAAYSMGFGVVGQNKRKKRKKLSQLQAEKAARRRGM